MADRRGWVVAGRRRRRRLHFRGPDAKQMITGTRGWSAAAVGGAGGRVQIRAECVTALHTYLGEMIS